VEILIHPGEHLLAVRLCAKDFKNAVRWSKIEGNNYCSRMVSGAAFLSTLYEIFGWNPECRYRARGVRRQKDDESVVIFDMREIEIFIPSDQIDAEEYLAENINPLILRTNKDVVVFPPSWASEFGNNYYRHAQARELALIDRGGMWNVAVEGQPFNNTPELNVTGSDVIAGNIEEMLNDMEQGGSDDGIGG